MTQSFRRRTRWCLLFAASLLALLLSGGSALAQPIPNPVPNPWQPPLVSAQQLLPDGGFEWVLLS
jgi:hypothetical protein